VLGVLKDAGTTTDNAGPALAVGDRRWKNQGLNGAQAEAVAATRASGTAP
jgi:hypothetical protein